MTPERRKKLMRAARNRQKGLRLVLEDMENPYNVGAMSRTAEAFGVPHLQLIFEHMEKFDPKAEGNITARSANKWIDYSVYEGTKATLENFKADGWFLVATVPDPKAISIYEADLTHPKLAILLGNERKGLTETALEMADIKLTIPMFGMVASYNVSVSAAILLYEITRQRQQSQIDYHYSEAETQAIFEDLQNRTS